MDKLFQAGGYRHLRAPAHGLLIGRFPIIATWSSSRACSAGSRARLCAIYGVRPCRREAVRRAVSHPFRHGVSCSMRLLPLFDVNQLGKWTAPTLG